MSVKEEEGVQDSGREMIGGIGLLTRIEPAAHPKKESSYALFRVCRRRLCGFGTQQ